MSAGLGGSQRQACESHLVFLSILHRERNRGREVAAWRYSSRAKWGCGWVGGGRSGVGAGIKQAETPRGKEESLAHARRDASRTKAGTGAQWQSEPAAQVPCRCGDQKAAVLG